MGAKMAKWAEQAVEPTNVLLDDSTGVRVKKELCQTGISCENTWSV